MKKTLLILSLMHLSACSFSIGTKPNKLNNRFEEVCQDGIVYLQHSAAGVTFKIDSDTLTPQLCDENGVEQSQLYLLQKKSKYTNNKGGQ